MCAPFPLFRSDASGVSMASVRVAGVDTLHITPSHQFPTGIVTSVSPTSRIASVGRPRCLAATLSKMITTASFAWLDARFLRFRESMLLSASLYTNTFSKASARLFVHCLHGATRPFGSPLSRGEMANFIHAQFRRLISLLARFMQRGEFERHVNRLRTHAGDVRCLPRNAYDALPQGSFTVGA